MPASRRVTWQVVTWCAGFLIVFVVLVLYIVSFFTRVPLDTPTAMAFLGIGSGLMGIPASLLAARNGNGSHLKGRDS